MLFALLKQWPDRISSVLARVEVLRSLRRAAAPPTDYQRGEQVLARLALVRIDDGILATAAALDPPHLRALDAIHLATALYAGRWSLARVFLLISPSCLAVKVWYS
ncbi:PIN domain-containing protein [Acidobacteria bacterium AH-259-O06]|nr:PIN domain-containing protein [Acidobacteria bacterium AH-259-O06]